MLTRKLENWLDQIPMHHEIAPMVEELLEVLDPDHQKMLQEIIEWYTHPILGATDIDEEDEDDI